MVFLGLITVSRIGAFYNEKFRWSFSDRHQFFLSGANDSDGFKFTDFYDDLRTASAFFVYLAPKEIPFFVEFSYNMLTYRGYIDSHLDQRRRSDQIDVFLSYYWFFPFTEDHKFTFSMGGRFSAFGNFGGDFIQQGWHALIGQKRPIVRDNWDSYRLMGYITGKAEYSWKDMIFVNTDLQVSYLGDFFVRGGIGAEFKNSFMTVEASIYMQQTYFHELKKESALWWTIQSENGLGFFYRLQTDHYFIYRDLVLANWSSDLNRGRFFSVGGQGIIIRTGAPKKDYEREKESIVPSTLSSSVGMRFSFNLPFNFSHSLLWVPRSHLPYTLSVGLASNNSYWGILSNRIFASFLWDFFQISFFGLFLETGASLSYDQWESGKANKYIYRPEFISQGISLSIGANLGFWIRFWHNQDHEYRLALFSGITYAPLAVRLPYPNSSFRTRFVHDLWNPNYFGLAMEIRPFQASLVRGKG